MTSKGERNDSSHILVMDLAGLSLIKRNRCCNALARLKAKKQVETISVIATRKLYGTTLATKSKIGRNIRMSRWAVFGELSLTQSKARSNLFAGSRF